MVNFERATRQYRDQFWICWQDCTTLASSFFSSTCLLIPPEPECGTNDKVLLVAREDGKLQAVDVRNRKTVCLTWWHIGGDKIAFLTCSYCDFPSAIHLLWGQITSQLLCIYNGDYSALWSRGWCHEPSGSTENWVGIEDCQKLAEIKKMNQSITILATHNSFRSR